MQDEIENVEFHLNEMKQMFSSSNPDIASAISGCTDPELNESHDLEQYSLRLDPDQMETTPEPTALSPLTPHHTETGKQAVQSPKSRVNSRKVRYYYPWTSR